MAERVLSEDEIQRRMPLWCALAELFLDTEIQPADYRAIAEAARSGGFSPAKVREVLEREVFPAFIFNLMDVAGEWAAFRPDDVRERVLGVLGQPGGYAPGVRPWTEGARTRFMAEEWPKIEAALDGSEPPVVAELVGAARPGWLVPVAGACLAMTAIGAALVFGWL